MAEKVPILVALGLDIDGRPHASRFDERDAPLVQRAAELMSFRVVRVPSDHALHAVAAELPLGKIFATGRAFVPFVGRLLFNKLAALDQGGVTKQAGPAPMAGPIDVRPAMFTTDAVAAADELWSKIEIGTMVLAAQPDLYGPGWWQSVVVAVDGDDLTLRWVDDPEEAPFHLARRDVGLCHPETD
jgi:hypothetical protein